jgi:hypothetical protein
MHATTFLSCALLIVYLFFPATLNISYKTESFALGVLFVCLCTFFSYLFFTKKVFSILLEQLSKTAHILFIIFLFWVTLFWLFDTDNYNYKAVISLPIFYLMLLASLLASSWLIEMNVNNQYIALRICYILLIASLVLGLFNITPFPSENNLKPMFIFTEPSLYALSFVPFLIYATILQASELRRVIILFVIGAAIVYLQSLTLLVGWLLVLIVTVKQRLMLISSLLLISVFFFVFGDLTYYFDRISIDEASDNLSVLVYMQGMQMMVHSLTGTSGLGIGFQNTGLRFTDVSASALINTIAGVPLNLTDGGFLAAKIVIEFGAIGILLICIITSLSLHSIKILRTLKTSNMPPVVIFSHACSASFIINMYVRDVGYITGHMLMYMTSLFIINRYNHR